MLTVSLEILQDQAERIDALARSVDLTVRAVIDIMVELTTMGGRRSGRARQPVPRGHGQRHEKTRRLEGGRKSDP